MVQLASSLPTDRTLVLYCSCPDEKTSLRAARTLGVPLDEVREGLDRLPAGRTPNKADWTRLSRSWRARLDEQIEALVALRDGLESCIGCGCLSLARCRLYNPGDLPAAQGPGARLLPPLLRRTPAEGV